MFATAHQHAFKTMAHLLPSRQHQHIVGFVCFVWQPLVWTMSLPFSGLAPPYCPQGSFVFSSLAKHSPPAKALFHLDGCVFGWALKGDHQGKPPFWGSNPKKTRRPPFWASNPKDEKPAMLSSPKTRRAQILPTLPGPRGAPGPPTEPQSQARGDHPAEAEGGRVEAWLGVVSWVETVAEKKQQRFLAKGGFRFTVGRQKPRGSAA